MLGLTLLNMRCIGVLMSPGSGENLFRVLGFALCFIGMGVALRAETIRASALTNSKPLKVFYCLAFWLSYVPILVGFAFGMAVCLIWRQAHGVEIDTINSGDWYGTVGWGCAIITAGLVSQLPRLLSTRFSRKGRNVPRCGE